MRLGINGRFLEARITGVQRFAREVTERLAALEEVVLFIPGDMPHDVPMPRGVRVARGRLGGRTWEQMELPRASRAEGVDIVLHPANAAPVFGPPGVVVIHDLTPLSHPWAYRPLYRAWVRLAHAGPAKRARRIVTVSDWSAGEIQRLLGVPAERITVVLQAADPLGAPATPEAVARVRGQYRLTRPYFIAVPEGDPKKRGDFLRRAWRSLGDVDADLVVVGAGFGAVHAAGDGSGSSSAPLGHVPDEDLRALLTGCVSLLFPSQAEGFGRPPLEALACGTRAVVAPYGPATQVLGTAADIVPLSVERWADRIRLLLAEDEHVRRVRIEQGRRHARGFSWDRVSRQIAEVCRAAAAETP